MPEEEELDEGIDDEEDAVVQFCRTLPVCVAFVVNADRD